MRPLALALILAGCASTATVPATPVSVAASPADTYTAALAIAGEKGWTVTTSDAAAGFFQATTPGNMGRWEDEVTVTVRASGPGSVVTARGIASYGGNRRYLSQYLSELSQRLASDGE